MTPAPGNGQLPNISLKNPAAAAGRACWRAPRLCAWAVSGQDGIIVPPGGSLKLVELAPNVQHVQGGGANNLIVAMKDHLVVFDAPYGELQSRWVIDEAKKKYPGKPIRYLVLTHHHMDHTGGTRTFMAEGATVIVPSPDKAYFEKVARMPHTVAPDELAKKRRAAVKVQEVKDQLSLKDDSEEIRLYNITNPHVDGMIIGHLVKPNIVYVTDILSPRGPIERNPGTPRRRRSAQEERHHQLHDRGRSWYDRQAGGDRCSPGDGSEQPLTSRPHVARRPVISRAPLFPHSSALVQARPIPSRHHRTVALVVSGVAFPARQPIKFLEFAQAAVKARHPQASVEF